MRNSADDSSQLYQLCDEENRFFLVHVLIKVQLMRISADDSPESYQLWCEGNQFFLTYFLKRTSADDSLELYQLWVERDLFYVLTVQLMRIFADDSHQLCGEGQSMRTSVYDSSEQCQLSCDGSSFSVLMGLQMMRNFAHQAVELYTSHGNGKIRKVTRKELSSGKYLLEKIW